MEDIIIEGVLKKITSIDSIPYLGKDIVFFNKREDGFIAFIISEDDYLENHPLNSDYSNINGEELVSITVTPNITAYEKQTDGQFIARDLSNIINSNNFIYTYTPGHESYQA